MKSPRKKEIRGVHIARSGIAIECDTCAVHGVAGLYMQPGASRLVSSRLISNAVRTATDEMFLLYELCAKRRIR